MFRQEAHDPIYCSEGLKQNQEPTRTEIAAETAGWSPRARRINSGARWHPVVRAQTYGISGLTGMGDGYAEPCLRSYLPGSAVLQAGQRVPAPTWRPGACMSVACDCEWLVSPLPRNLVLARRCLRVLRTPTRRVTPVGWTGPAVAPPSGCLTKHSGDSADVAAIIGGVRSMENGIAGFGSIHPKAVNQHRFYA